MTEPKDTLAPTSENEAPKIERRPVVSPPPATAKDDEVGMLILPMHSTSAYPLENVRAATERDTTLSTEDLKLLNNNYMKEAGRSTWVQPPVDFNNPSMAQFVEVDDKRIMSRVAMPDKRPGRLVGAEAVRHISMTLNTANLITCKLWSSGLTVVLDVVSPKEFFHLQNTLISQRTEIGAKTNGKLWSYDDGTLVVPLVDFVLDKIVDANLRIAKGEVMRDEVARLLLPQDIWHLLAALGKSVYPKGYPIMQACNFVTDEGASCNFTTMRDGISDVSELKRIDFLRSCWILTDKLSPAHRQHMAAGMGTVDAKAILAYQADVAKQFKATYSDIVETGDTLYYLNLKTPHYPEYRSHIMSWIDEVRLRVERQLETTTDVGVERHRNRRQRLIGNLIAELGAQRDAHWIDSIRTVGSDGQENTIEDYETIMAVLGELSKNKTVRDNVEAAIADYTKNTQITFVGYESWVCPDCGHGNEGPESQPDIIPWNIVGSFFGIAAFRSLKHN